MLTVMLTVMLTAQPTAALVRARLLPQASLPLRALATRSWIVAPPVTRAIPPAIFLPGQLERVEHWEFAAEHPGKKMLGGYHQTHGATVAYEVEDVELVDGVLHKGRAVEYLKRRAHRWPRVRIEQSIDRAALACTEPGGRWFGNWLIDDCILHPLAAECGTPVTPAAKASEHMADYTRRLGCRTTPVVAARLATAVLFDDVGQNDDKRRRFRQARDRLVADFDCTPHPGVFLVRGAAGDRRILRNEQALAQRLAASRGLKVVDPMTTDVATVVGACAGARVIVGIEGSQLAHGAIAMGAGGKMLVLQPPGRFVDLFKDLADRDGQRFGFVVGARRGDDTWVDPDEVERTLDLLDAAPCLGDGRR